MPLYHPVVIGNLVLNGNIFLAPVAGYSDRAFRSICYECGCDFAFSEMVSSEALVRTSEKTHILMYRAENEAQYGVQIFGSDPSTMAQAARVVYETVHPELIDINAGCPVQKIVKTGAGSSLTRDPDRLYAVVRATVQALSENSLPVTVKIRSGWDDSSITWKEAALAAVEAGASAVTLHPRTRAQGYEGKAQWKFLADLVELIGNRVPVFGSGDLMCAEDARCMLSETKCSAVMFARGAMGNPFIFTQTKQLLAQGFYDEVSYQQRLQTALTELQRLADDVGEETACRQMRKRFCSYAKGIPNAAHVRAQIVRALTIADYMEIYIHETA